MSAAAVGVKCLPASTLHRKLWLLHYHLQAVPSFHLCRTPQGTLFSLCFCWPIASLQDAGGLVVERTSKVASVGAACRMCTMSRNVVVSLWPVESAV